MISGSTDMGCDLRSSYRECGREAERKHRELARKLDAQEVHAREYEGAASAAGATARKRQRAVSLLSKQLADTQQALR